MGSYFCQISQHTHTFCYHFFPKILFQGITKKVKYIRDVYCYYIQFQFSVLGVAKLAFVVNLSTTLH